MEMIQHHPERKKEILLKYKNKHAISQLAITNYEHLKRFDATDKQGKNMKLKLERLQLGTSQLFSQLKRNS